MYRIPRVVPPCEDELLASWILRLSSENGFDRVKDFFNAYVVPNEALGSLTMTMDFRVRFEYLWRALPHDTDERSLFFRTSTFTGVAPFFTEGQRQRYINQAFNTNEKLSPLFPFPHGTVPSMFICPECATEELDTRGFFTFHRAHHLPGVKVCHIHRCTLGRVTKGYLQLSCCKIPPYKCEDVTDVNHAVEYARFAKEFLDAEFDVCITDIIDRLRDLLTDVVCDDMCSNHLDYLSEDEIRKLRTADPTYISHPSMLAAIRYLFHNISAFKQFVYQIQDGQEQAFKHALQTHSDYEMVGAFRRDLVMIRHRVCGETTCTSPYGFQTGWRCVVCDRQLSLQEKYERLIDAAGDSDYVPVGRFVSMNQQVEIQHRKCGRINSMKPRQFLYEGRRCNCSWQVRREDAKRNVEKYDGFELISFERTDRPMTIRHACGGEFTIYYHKFFERPHCRVCQRKGHLAIRTSEDFRQDLWDLVGDEYSLVGEYNGPHSYLQIKHNVCGTGEIIPIKNPSGTSPAYTISCTAP